MNRRRFSQSFGLGAIGAALAPVSRAADVSRPARSEKKEWAREHLKGLGGLILPSFTPDFKSLDEDGIRLDRWFKRHYPGLTHGAYGGIHAWGSAELKQRYLPKLVSGQWAGTMCLTEAHAGTDLGIKSYPGDEWQRRLH